LTFGYLTRQPEPCGARPHLLITAEQADPGGPADELDAPAGLMV
jgi:hypothetical protein